MAEGYGDVTENPGRMTVEKRGDGPTGGIAWRFITSSDQIETVGAERVVREFDANRTYFWEASWRNNFFNVLIRLDGANGPEHYGMGKPYEGFYHPEPHVVYAGGGPARGGRRACGARRCRGRGRRAGRRGSLAPHARPRARRLHRRRIRGGVQPGQRKTDR